MRQTTRAKCGKANHITRVTDSAGRVGDEAWHGPGELLSLNRPDAGITTTDYDACVIGSMSSSG